MSGDEGGYGRKVRDALIVAAVLAVLIALMVCALGYGATVPER